MVYSFILTPAGIDYTHPAFINADGTTSIFSIWDQSIPFSLNGSQPEGIGRLPEGIGYGTEYRAADLNEALTSADPWSVVPSRDTDGHGTFTAGVICGKENLENDFSGVAPLAQVCMVKCKQAKENLKEYYRMTTEAPCYMENDIMMGVRYLQQIAFETQRPMVIFLGMGTNMGSHNRGGALGEMLENLGDYRGIGIVTCGGNEANASHHYRSSNVVAGGEVEVELRVGDRRSGFTLELWSDAPQLFSVGLISPGGEYSGKTYARLGESREVNFLLENTRVNIDYLRVSFASGDECIRMRFQTPNEGIWTIRVFNETSFEGRFDIWMPMKGFVSDANFFLRADPNVTLCDPASNIQVISTTFYDGENRSVNIDSSRGYSRSGSIRPDVAAPGVKIFGPFPRQGTVYPPTEEERRRSARYGFRSGSSCGGAVTTGIVALLLEWGNVRENDYAMDTIAIQKYLIRGANREGRDFPNQEWGYGTVNLYGAFEGLRQR